ncbi:MAG: hypothetical protein D6731_14705 [Planctomycetota bacterium]|nr:MAG: hypothetical protein D6731_14705 [Planctomycetota bacterium]
MSDARLRALERRYRRSGCLEDHVRYLRSALRASALSAERLGLAAALGHPAARAVLGADAPPLLEALLDDPLPRALGPLSPAGDEALSAWAQALAGWGQRVAVGGAVAAAEAVLPRWTWEHPSAARPWPASAGAPPDARPALALEAARGWLHDPGPARARAAARAAEAVREVLEGTFYAWAMDAAMACAQAALLAALGDGGDPASPLAFCLRCARDAESAWRRQEAARAGRRPLLASVGRRNAEAWLRNRVASALVAWALDEPPPGEAA